MNDTADQLPITYNAFKQRHVLTLPGKICDSLLIPNHPIGKPLTICHRKEDELVRFRYEILEANDTAEQYHNNEKRIAKRNSRFGLVGIFCLLAIKIFINPIISDRPSLKWPINIGIGVVFFYCCYLVVVNFLLPGITSSNKKARLSLDLKLIEIHKRIYKEFSC